MVEPSPIVSICIPTYNGAAYVRETVASALGQSEPSLEVVVSDDGSSDDTLNLVADFNDPRIRILPTADRVGAAENWNRAVGAARGSHIKLLCQDDVLAPDAVRVELAALDKVRSRGVTPAFASSRRRIIRDDGRVVIRARGHGGLPHVVDRATALRAIVRYGTNVFGEPSFTLFPRETIERVGSFDDAWCYLIDLDYYVRALASGPAVAVDAVGGAFRLSVGSWSSELATDQLTETRAFMQRVLDEAEGVVTTGDRFLGAVGLRAAVVGRRVLYAYMAATS